MSEFIHALESRKLMSTTVTVATLAADKGTIVADVVDLKADLTSLNAADAIQVKAIAANFKGLPKSDQAVLKTLEKDETKDHSVISKDISSLTSLAGKSASKSTSAGVTLFSKATVKSVDSLELDITQLKNVTVLPLASLDAQLSATTISNAFAAINAAFPTNTALVTAVNTAQTTDASGKSVIGNGAAVFQADVQGLANDLTAVQLAYGSFPNLIGDYNGTVTQTTGPEAGGTFSVDFEITTESPTGIVEGAAVNNTVGGSEPLKGTVTLNGKATLKTRDTNGVVTFVLQLSGTSLAGTYSSPRTRGIATLTETTT